jgi:hypothetical protein
MTEEALRSFRMHVVPWILALLSVGMISCDKSVQVPPPPLAQNLLHIWRDAPAQIKVGQPFIVRLTVRVEQALPAVLVKELFGGLTLVDRGAEFTIAQGETLQGVILQPGPGTVRTFVYQLRCSQALTYTIVGEASTRGADPVFAISTITCVE